MRSNRERLDSGKKSQKRKYGVSVSHGMMGKTIEPDLRRSEMTHLLEEARYGETRQPNSRDVDTGSLLAGLCGAAEHTPTQRRSLPGVLTFQGKE